MVSLSTLFGCNGTYCYSLVFENQRVEGDLMVSIKSRGGMNIPYQSVIAQGWSTYTADFKTPPNDYFIVNWVDEDGNRFSAESDMGNNLSRRFKGYIYFSIKQDNNIDFSASKEYREEKLFVKTVEGSLSK
jgi:hypothetical protein